MAKGRGSLDPVTEDLLRLYQFMVIPRHPSIPPYSGTRSRRLVCGWGGATGLHCLPTVLSSVTPVCGCGEGWLKVRTCGVAVPVDHPCGRQAGRLASNGLKSLLHVYSVTIPFCPWYLRTLAQMFFGSGALRTGLPYPFLVCRHPVVKGDSSGSAEAH